MRNRCSRDAARGGLAQFMDSPRLHVAAVRPRWYQEMHGRGARNGDRSEILPPPTREEPSAMATRPLNILLFGIDSLRADHMSATATRALPRPTPIVWLPRASCSRAASAPSVPTHAGLTPPSSPAPMSCRTRWSPSRRRGGHRRSPQASCPRSWRGAGYASVPRRLRRRLLPRVRQAGGLRRGLVRLGRPAGAQGREPQCG